MAGILYSITECFALTTEEQIISNEPPSSIQTINVQSRDCLEVCTDGIHDLVASK